MARIIMKFGGSSLADNEKIKQIASIITKSYDEGHQIVAVLSAQGDTTDELIQKAQSLTPSQNEREMDMLLACGEQMSIALMTMYLTSLGYPAISLTGWQAGIQTSNDHTHALIKRINTTRILQHLNQGKIVLVAGFQGISEEGNITTLGRGGSDTTAVALAIALKCDHCRFYKDVDGIYTTDPHRDTNAQKLSEVSYDQMYQMTLQGAQVLHDRCVKLAQRFNVVLEVLSSFQEGPGTRISASKY